MLHLFHHRPENTTRGHRIVEVVDLFIRPEKTKRETGDLHPERNRRGGAAGDTKTKHGSKSGTADGGNQQETGGYITVLSRFRSQVTTGEKDLSQHVFFPFFSFYTP